MRSTNKAPTARPAKGVDLILGIVLLQTAVLLLVIGIIYMAGGIRAESGADPDPSWAAGP